MKKAYHASQATPSVSQPSVAAQTSYKDGMSGKVGSRTMLPSSSSAPQLIIGTAVPAATRSAAPDR